jgi:hypothetical protein
MRRAALSLTPTRRSTVVPPSAMRNSRNSTVQLPFM